MFTILQAIILGSLQGVLEWLPVSSEGIITLVGLIFFGEEFQQALYFAIWLHTGTLAAAMVYFRREIIQLLKAFIRMLKEGRIHPEDKSEKLLSFILIATLSTAAIGTPLLILASNLELPPFYTTLTIGMLLLVTGFLNKMRTKNWQNPDKNIQKEGWAVGVFQAFSIIPGLSRSGLTVFYLLARNFNPTKSLKLSFLISIPAILGGNVLLGLLNKSPSFSTAGFVGALFAFILGLVTIKSLIKIADAVNFAYFCFILGGVTIAISLFLV